MFFIFILFYILRQSRQGQIWRMKEGHIIGREGCGVGRIREESAAICLHVQLTVCEEAAGRYESHKPSC